MATAIKPSDITKITLTTKDRCWYIKYRKPLLRKEGWYEDDFTGWNKLTEEYVRNNYRIENNIAFIKPYITIQLRKGSTILRFETIDEAQKAFDKLVKDNNLYDVKKVFDV